MRDQDVELADGAVVIAAITSCTNTSNPAVMLGAGLLARNAARIGLKTKPWVKTSLGPGSLVVTDYLRKAGVLDDLATLGFDVVGYGCTTCIGNSGPLPDEVSRGIAENDLVVTSVLSGNRNFEGRVHPEVKMNYLASPPLVVAYALAGTVDIDLTTEPLGTSSDGQPVFLRDIWPSNKEIGDTIAATIGPELFKQNYADVFKGDSRWNEIAAPEGESLAWSEESTYIKKPPY
jgi:aconitate hydratase